MKRKLKKNKPGGKIEYKSNRIPAKIATKKAYPGLTLFLTTSNRRIIIKTRVKDNPLGDKG